MEERLPIRREEKTGISRSAMRIWGMVIIALGILSRGILQNRVLGLGANSGQQLMELLSMEGGMAAATTALALQAIEGSAVPIFATLLVDGAERTGNLQKYLLRVLAMAALSEIPFNLAVSGRFLDLTSRNPGCGLALALMMLYFFEQYPGKSVKNLSVKVAVTLAAVLWAALFRVQYGVSMVLIVCTVWCFRDRNTLRLFLGAAMALCCCVGDPLFMFAPMGFLLVSFYNGEEGNSVRPLQYAMYPIVLLCIGAVGFMMF